MKTLRGVAWILAGIATCVALPEMARAANPVRPNLLFILADDLGLDGVSCYGSDARKTPEIDRLASNGLRFTQCYAAPLCGPSRCLLQTGRYAFRTGGLTNQSWRPGGLGAKSANEQPLAKVLKAAGYATGMAGKWRQVGETPRDWGYDEYSTDPAAGGWYWQNTHEQNGHEITVPPGTYAPDVVHAFAVDFIRRHKDGPFFFYYAMHLVHAPIQHTPDSKPGAPDGPGRYDDDIAYMDKQVGAIVAELERLGIRDNTLVVFSGDNGTALNFPSPIHGRMINGRKGSMLEGGARVPLIASWPRATPVGRTSDDLVSFADVLPTFAELAGASLPAGFTYDGRSFAAQLQGKPGNPRDHVYVQLGRRWYVRDRGFKLTEQGELFDLSDAPFVEKLVPAGADTDASKAARARLQAVLTELNPAGGKTESGVDAPKKKGRRANRVQ